MGIVTEDRGSKVAKAKDWKFALRLIFKVFIVSYVSHMAYLVPYSLDAEIEDLESFRSFSHFLNQTFTPDSQRIYHNGEVVGIRPIPYDNRYGPFSGQIAPGGPFSVATRTKPLAMVLSFIYCTILSVSFFLFYYLSRFKEPASEAIRDVHLYLLLFSAAMFSCVTFNQNGPGALMSLLLPMSRELIIPYWFDLRSILIPGMYNENDFYQTALFYVIAMSLIVNVTSYVYLYLTANNQSKARLAIVLALGCFLIQIIPCFFLVYCQLFEFGLANISC